MPKKSVKEDLLAGLVSDITTRMKSYLEIFRQQTELVTMATDVAKQAHEAASAATAKVMELEQLLKSTQQEVFILKDKLAKRENPASTNLPQQQLPSKSSELIRKNMLKKDEDDNKQRLNSIIVSGLPKRTCANEEEAKDVVERLLQEVDLGFGTKPTQVQFIGRDPENKSKQRTALVTFKEEDAAKRILPKFFNHQFKLSECSDVRIRYNRSRLFRTAQYRMYRVFEFLQQSDPDLGFCIRFGKPRMGTIHFSVYDFLAPIVEAGNYTIPVEKIVSGKL